MTPFNLSVTTLWEAPGSPLIDDAEVYDLIHYTLAMEGASEDWTITVLLTTDERLRILHRDFMGLDSATDIMTFPYQDEGSAAIPDHQEMGGDIVISVDCAAVQAEEEGWDTASEIRFLIVHGVLHLVGWRDDKPAFRDSMLAHQRALLRTFKRPG